MSPRTDETRASTACARITSFTISSLTVHRFIIAAISVGSKALSDAFCTNGRYARVGGISVVEMNLLEKEFCEALDWRLTVRHFLFPSWPGLLPPLSLADPLSRSAHCHTDFRSGPCTLLHVSRSLPSLLPTVDRSSAFTTSASRTREDSRPFTDLDFDLDTAVPAKAQLESTNTTSSRTTPKCDGRGCPARACAIVSVEHARVRRQRTLLVGWQPIIRRHYILFLLLRRQIDILASPYPTTNRSGHGSSRAAVIFFDSVRRQRRASALPAQLVSQRGIRYRFESTFTCSRS